MSIDTVLVSRGPGETRVALLAGDQLVELRFERDGAESAVGGIYLGRVQSVNRSIDAAFVDIGLGRDGFLAAAEARPSGTDDNREDGTAAAGIADHVAEGDAVLVQVQRDPTDAKGAKLTSHMGIAGVSVVLRPDQPGVQVSRRIADAAVRTRLADAVAAVAPDDAGFIIRTAAEAAAPETVAAEAAALAERWRQLRLKRANSRAPALMLAPPLVAWRAVRDFAAGIVRVVVDDADQLAALKALAQAEMPALVRRIERHAGTEELFEATGVEAAIEAALDPEVPLASGGRITISETPALTAIDVDTAGADAGGREATALAVDLEAAAEIARQIRLRNIAGLIAVDFVPLRDAGRRDQVMAALRDAVLADPKTPRVAGRTALGLVEMTRRRTGVSLLETMAGPWVQRAEAAPVRSAVTRALDALRRVRRQGAGLPARGLVLRVPPDVAQALLGPAEGAMRQAEAALGLEIRAAADQSLAAGEIEIAADKGDGK